jgi:thymidylate synthase (FAD)
MSPKVVAVTQPLVGGKGDWYDCVEKADRFQAYVARVSSPQNQSNLGTSAKLLKYCADKQHWSVFETCYLTMELETSVAIAAQILRHRSFTFQQFSARYADPTSMGFAPINARKQDTKNRQNSTDDLSEEDKRWFDYAMADLEDHALQAYQGALARGIAKESARFLLPQSQTTRMYMTGNVRSWITYFKVRAFGEGVQQEHRDLAFDMAREFEQYFPITFEAFFPEAG